MCNCYFIIYSISDRAIAARPERPKVMPGGSDAVRPMRVLPACLPRLFRLFRALVDVNMSHSSAQPYCGNLRARGRFCNMHFGGVGRF
jgi:hypothetical protein